MRTVEPREPSRLSAALQWCRTRAATLAPSSRSTAVLEAARLSAGRYRSEPGNAVKVRARYAVRQAVRSGLLKREPCRECGAGLAQAHHADYLRPLDVTWLCSGCHGAAHWALQRGAFRVPD